MEIACLIISGLALLAVIVLIILVLKQKNSAPANADFKELGALSKQLDSLSNEMRTSIKLTVIEELNKINANSLSLNEQNNQKLERFQTGITESIQKRFDSLNSQIQVKMAEISAKVDNSLTQGFKNTSETFTQVRERLQAIDAAQKNIENLSKDVVSLKNVLEGNQSRGQYGEYQLNMVLNNVFGDTVGCYETQYTIKKAKDGSDTRADAVVFLPEPNKMICIDSKFPFPDYARAVESENDEEKEKLIKEFGNAVKKHITTIKDKYIVEGKTSYQAIMFIPNDGVFAFIHHNLYEVVEYARKQNVIITSPSTLPAILVTINMIRLDYERSKNVKIISKQLDGLGKQFKSFADEWETFSSQLERATRSREKLDSRVGKISTKFEAISTASENNENEVDGLPLIDEN